LKEALQVAKKLTQDKPDLPLAWSTLGTVLEAQRSYDEAQGAFAVAMDKQANYPLAIQGMARCEYGLNKPTEALRFIMMGLKQTPNDPSLKQMLIIHDLNFGNPQAAVTLLDQQIMQTPDNPRLYSSRGDAYLRIAHNQMVNNHRDDALVTIQFAIKQLNDALVKYPDESSLYITLADAAVMSGKPDEAEVAYKTWGAREKSKDNPDPHIMLAQLYGLNNQPDAAEGEMQTALKLSNNRTDLEMAMVDLLEAHKKFDDAAKLLQTVNADSPMMRAKLIEVLQMAGKLDDAEAMIKTDLAKYPANKETMLALWANLLLNKNDYNGALQHANEALALNPDDGSAMYYRARARLRTVPPDARGALEDLKHVAQLESDKPMVRRNLAAAYLELNQPEDAASELEAAVQLQPKDKQIRMMLVQIYQTLPTPRLAQALALLHAVDTTPPFDTDPDIFQSEALLLSQQGDTDGAIKMSARAQRLKPADPLLFRSHLELLLKATKYQDALKLVDKAPDAMKNSWWLLLDRGVAEKNLNNLPAAATDMKAAVASAVAAKDDAAFVRIADTFSSTLGNDAAIAEMEPLAGTLLRAKLKLAVLYQARGNPGDLQHAIELIDQAMTGLDRAKKEDQIATLSIAAQLYQTATPKPLADKAYNAYEKWLALVPDDITALNNVAWLLSDQFVPPRLPEALQNVKKAVDLMNKTGRTEPRLLDTYGWLLIQTGNPVEGIRVLNKVIDQEPFPEAYLHLGEGLLKNSYAKQARENAQSGLDMMDKQMGKDQDPIIRQKLTNLASRADAILKSKQQAQVP
jgi:tetratricopeptide (TPR) repeat protein